MCVVCLQGDHVSGGNSEASEMKREECALEWFGFILNGRSL